MKKIAIPLTSDNRVDDHFGHCEFYGVYTIADNKEITDFQTIQSQQGCGCKSNIAAVLSNQGVATMLAGGIGAGAINVLNHWGINVVRGCSGLAQDVIAAYLNGDIIDNGESCQHHEHHHQNGQQCHN